MSVLVFSLLLATSSALLAPMTNGNGEYDIGSVSNHVLLLEQMMSALTTKVSAQANTLTAATTSWTGELSTMKSKYDALESKYQTLQTTLENERKLRDERDRNLTASIALLNTEVKYEVVLIKDITDQKDKQALKFDTVKYNVGGGYHSASGIFVAPASGSYLFWCHVMNYESSSILYIHLLHEGSLVVKGYAPNFLDVASITTMLHLHAGDTIWYQNEGGPSKFHGSWYSSFGGALLHID